MAAREALAFEHRLALADQRFERTLQSEVRMRQDPVGIAPCDRSRLMVSVDNIAPLMGTAVEASVIDWEGNPGHTVSLLLQ